MAIKKGTATNQVLTRLPKKPQDADGDGIISPQEMQSFGKEPNPTVTATEKKTKSSYIPCSTDYKTMKGLVDKAKIKKKYPWSKVQKPKVMAIPLNQFINTLKTSEENNIKEIKVIPTPSSLKVINQVNSNK